MRFRLLPMHSYGRNLVFTEKLTQCTETKHIHTKAKDRLPDGLPTIRGAMTNSIHTDFIHC